MNDRKSVSKKIRFEVFKRDGFQCQYCGRTPPSVILECDHIDPVNNGGSNDMDNLISACFDCNRGKSANLLSDIPKSLKEKAEETKEREEQILGYNQIMTDKRNRIEDEMWCIVDALEGAVPESYDRRRVLSIKRFLEVLPFSEVLNAADITYSKFGHTRTNAFKYFCGICWRIIKDGGY